MAHPDRPDDLPLDHHCGWRAWAEKLEVELAKTQERVTKLEHELEILKRHVFGRRSEKMPAIANQLRVGAPAAPPDRGPPAWHRELPTRTIRHLVREEQRVCPRCGRRDLRPLGAGKTTVVIERLPAAYERQIHVQETLACVCGEGIVTAEVDKAIEQGHYGPAFLAHLVVAKCADSIPIYRLEKSLRRQGIDIKRSTMVDQFHQVARLVVPIADHAIDEVRATEIVLADETPTRVMAKRKCRTAYLWTFVTDDIVAYRFSPTRAGATAADVLGGTSGALVVDAYTGYNAVTTPEGRTRVGCWAHVRRRFFDAQSTAPVAGEMLALILELYRVEHDARAAKIVRTAEHRRLRAERSRTMVDQIRAWLDTQQPLHPPRSPIGQAIAYTMNQWTALARFLDDERLPLDNNASERALRVPVLGRKNYLFVGNDDAGRNIAALYTLVATCDRHGINPEEYLADILVRIHTHPQSRIGELLPHRWKSMRGPPTPA